MSGAPRILLDEGDGPAAILLPGLSLDHRLYAPVAARLAPRFRLVVPRIARAGSIDAMARRAFAAADALGVERFHLGGLSLGGYAALAAWGIDGGRRIKSLALMNTQAGPDGPAALKRRAWILRLCAEGRHQSTVGPFLHRILAPANARRPELRALVLAMTGDAGAEAMAEDTRAILARGDYRGVLPTIDAPTLVLAGARDALTPPSESRALAQAVAGAELRILDGCGHLCPLEDPDSTAALLGDFLVRAEQSSAEIVQPSARPAH